MRWIHFAATTLFVGVGLLMAPVPKIVTYLGAFVFVLGMILGLYGVSILGFSSRMVAMKYSFWTTLAALFPLGMVTAPKLEWAAQIGNAINAPWLMALYYATGYTSIFIGSTAFAANVLATGSSFLRSGDGDGPPGPEDL